MSAWDSAAPSPLASPVRAAHALEHDVDPAERSPLGEDLYPHDILRKGERQASLKVRYTIKATVRDSIAGALFLQIAFEHCSRKSLHV